MRQNYANGQRQKPRESTSKMCHVKLCWHSPLVFRWIPGKNQLQNFVKSCHPSLVMGTCWIMPLSHWRALISRSLLSPPTSKSRRHLAMTTTDILFSRKRVNLNTSFSSHSMLFKIILNIKIISYSNFIVRNIVSDQLFDWTEFQHIIPQLFNITVQYVNNNMPRILHRQPSLVP